jgi:inhibitor of cysteine peptidase
MIMLSGVSKVSIALVAVALIAPNAVGFARAAASSASDAVFQFSDNGSTKKIRIGHRFIIRLDENPSTGFTWSKPEFDSNCLRLASDDYLPQPGPRVGAGGIHKFEFTVMAACRTTIVAAYRRPWESVPPSRTFKLGIVGTRPQ